ncbi:MAG TPA: peptidoglycan DD-metalloendopeptidase family protein [Myxococcota bacterium]|nr:peptidoglycan DD-metalloendopeptidase family protein [Myxococcota bacterium]
MNSGFGARLAAALFFTIAVFVPASHSRAGALGAGLFAVGPTLAKSDLRSVLPAIGDSLVLAPELDRSTERGADSDPTLTIVTGRVPRNGTLSGALRGSGVAPEMVETVARSLRGVFDVRSARPGDFYALIRDQSGQLLSFEFQRGRAEVYRVERDTSGNLITTRETAALERRLIQLGGVVKRSLFDSMVELGESPSLVHAFTDIFAWDFDFSTQTRPGDEFRIVFEKYYDKDGFVRYGRVQAAEYRAARKDFVAVWFEDENGTGGYFSPDGNSLKRSFLAAPLKYSRISSRYTMSRMHPLLHERRPHEGVDYAAPVGTPVWAVSDGEVIFVGWSGGFGQMVRIKHRNGFMSSYAHLSRFARGLYVGQHVAQKQLLGFVGATGLATGPHLDFRLAQNGRFVDPLRLHMEAGDPVPPRSRSRFLKLREERLSELQAAHPAIVLDAAM